MALNQPSPWCNVGTVVDVGDGVRFCIGDRVANGPHAELVLVHKIFVHIYPIMFPTLQLFYRTYLYRLARCSVG